MKIIVNPLDIKSINRAIKQIEVYRQEFEQKEQEFVRRLAEVGVSVATTGFQIADYDGENDVVVTMNQSGTQATVVASGKTVGFIEFGTGVRYPEWDSTGMDYTPPKHGTYGKGKGAKAKVQALTVGGLLQRLVKAHRSTHTVICQQRQC